MTNEEALAEIARFAAEDRAADALYARFVEMGLNHAEFAIDQRADYEDARASFEQNLHDTLADEHKGIANFLVEAAITAYNEAWDVFTLRSAAR